MRRCSKCGIEKPASEFHRDSAAKDGLYAYCKPCNVLVQREKRSGGKLKGKERDYMLRSNYGITSKEYEIMLMAQNGKCAICGGVDIDRSLAVDHCHETGKIRGLLCWPCNAAIGLFKEKTESLLSAVNYLVRAYKYAQ